MFSECCRPLAVFAKDDGSCGSSEVLGGDGDAVTLGMCVLLR